MKDVHNAGERHGDARHEEHTTHKPKQIRNVLFAPAATVALYQTAQSEVLLDNDICDKLVDAQKDTSD